MRKKYDDPGKIIRIRESDYYQLMREFGEVGKPMNHAVTKCVNLATEKLSAKGKQELASGATA
jgi:hypothetical protein